MWVKPHEANLIDFVKVLRSNTASATVTMNQWRMVLFDSVGAVTKTNLNVFLSIGFTAAAKMFSKTSKNVFKFKGLQPVLLDKHLHVYCNQQQVLGDQRPSENMKALVGTNCPFFAKSRLFNDVLDKTSNSEPKIDDDYLTLYGGTLEYFYAKTWNWYRHSEDKPYLEADKPLVLGHCQDVFIELKLDTDVNSGAFLEKIKSPASIQLYRLLSTPMIVRMEVTSSTTESPHTNGIVHTEVE